MTAPAPTQGSGSGAKIAAAVALLMAAAAVATQNHVLPPAPTVCVAPFYGIQATRQDSAMMHISGDTLYYVKRDSSMLYSGDTLKLRLAVGDTAHLVIVCRDTSKVHVIAAQ